MNKEIYKHMLETQQLSYGSTITPYLVIPGFISQLARDAKIYRLLKRLGAKQITDAQSLAESIYKDKTDEHYIRTAFGVFYHKDIRRITEWYSIVSMNFDPATLRDRLDIARQAAHRRRCKVSSRSVQMRFLDRNRDYVEMSREKYASPASLRELLLCADLTEKTRQFIHRAARIDEDLYEITYSPWVDIYNLTYYIPVKPDKTGYAYKTSIGSTPERAKQNYLKAQAREVAKEINDD